MSTVALVTIQKSCDELFGWVLVDAPVSGGALAAQAGKLGACAWSQGPWTDKKASSDASCVCYGHCRQQAKPFCNGNCEILVTAETFGLTVDITCNGGERRWFLRPDECHHAHCADRVRAINACAFGRNYSAQLLGFGVFPEAL
jgi:hypothetical protein